MLRRTCFCGKFGRDVAHCFCVSKAWAAISTIPFVHARVVSEKPISLAQKIGDEHIVEKLMTGGVNGDQPTTSSNDDLNGVSYASPLAYASYMGYKKLVEALIDAGAHINAKDSQGQTSLYLATHRGNTEVAELLMAQGADINEAEIDGLTPLIVAAYGGHTDLVHVLINAGARVNDAHKWGATALFIGCATRVSDIKLIQALIDGGTYLNCQDNEGCTALYVASRNGHVDAVRALIDAGADVNLVNKIGETALDAVSNARHANEGNRPAIQSALRDAGNEHELQTLQH